LWRIGFDAVERAIGLPLETLVRADAYFEAVALSTRAQQTARVRLERLSRRALHLLNLPAGSDVRRVSDQVARLDRHVLALAKQLDD
jgi:hypothetical protein